MITDSISKPTIKQTSRNVLTFTHVYQKDSEFWYHLGSDLHLDSLHSRLDLYKAELDECRKKGGYALLFGDIYDVMQGRNDRRANKQSLKPEDLNQPYWNGIIKQGYDLFHPYADVVKLFGYGNHETAIMQKTEFDVLSALTDKINANSEHKVYTGGYGGYVRFQFARDNGSCAQTFILKYRHSGGSLGLQTMGFLGVKRMMSDFPDADIVVTGDNHDSWYSDPVRERINDQGRIYHAPQVHVKVPGYKEEYNDGNMGWHVETNKPPKPLGGWWLQFYFARNREMKRNEIKFRLIRTT